MRWRRCTAPGCSSSSLVYACGAAVSPNPNATLRSAPQARAELTDAGTVPAFADEVERGLEAPPSAC
jgi:hypothetical protein